MEVREQLVEVSSCFPPCGSWVSASDHETQPQGLEPAQPLCVLTEFSRPTCTPTSAVSPELRMLRKGRFSTLSRSFTFPASLASGGEQALSETGEH